MTSQKSKAPHTYGSTKQKKQHVLTMQLYSSALVLNIKIKNEQSQAHSRVSS